MPNYNNCISILNEMQKFYNNPNDPQSISYKNFKEQNVKITNTKPSFHGVFKLSDYKKIVNSFVKTFMIHFIYMITMY